MAIVDSRGFEMEAAWHFGSPMRFAPVMITMRHS